ncbi:MAG: hypothetical protein ACI9XP_000392 [Lentimonas sp.]|jgi:hypothetical protein
MFTPLNLPQASLKLTKKENKVYVFCEVRRKKLVLTPEEWVRQHFLHYLINQHNLSKNKLVSEMQIDYNGMSRRPDIVFLDEDHKPKMIVECKAPEIKLSVKTFDQIAQYNRTLDVNILVMTNGIEHWLMNIHEDGLTVHKDLNKLSDWIS